MGVRLKHSWERGGDSGFVLVDALTALVVLSLVLTVCIVTVRISLTASRSTSEAREAHVLLSSLLETTPRQSGIYQGTSGVFSYRTRVADSEINNVHLCHIDATVQAKKRTRAYRLSGTRWCESLPA